MSIDTAKILESLRSRQSGDRWGIGVAAQYLKSIVPCLEGNGFCPTNVFGYKSAADWTKALAESESKLVFCDDEMLVKDFSNEASSLTEGSILDFDAYVTTTSVDRDLDLLESKGADLDPAAPLLFNHIPMMPTGRMVKLLEQNDRFVKSKFALANVAIGGDMAALISLKALRLSHGFRPIEFEPRTAKSGLGEPAGWHIKRFSIIEVSLVPVPANTDAIITAFSRAKLTTAFVKGWAKDYFDNRPVQGRGFDAAAQQQQGGCGCGTKSGEKAGSVSNSSVMGTVGDSPSNGAAAAGGAMRVSITCPKCGAAFDLTSVPSGMDLSAMSCPMCGNGAPRHTPDASTGDHGESNQPGGVSDSAINSVRGLNGSGSANASSSPAGTKEGKVFSSDNHTLLKNCDGHLCSVVEGINNAHGLVKQLLTAAGTGKGAGAGNNLTDDMNDSIGDKNLRRLLVKSVEVSDDALRCGPSAALTSDAFATKYLGGAIEPYLKGSFEWISDQLKDTAVGFLCTKGIAFSQDVRANILGCYPAYAIVCVRDWSADVYPCYRMDWAADENGVPAWTGEVKKVEITATVVEKAMGGRGALAMVRKSMAAAIAAGDSKAAAGYEAELIAVMEQAKSGIDVIESERAGDGVNELEAMLAGVN